MSDKVRDNSEIETTLQEASRHVRQLAEPRPAGDSVKAAILRASRKLPSWSSNRVRDVWYADPKISVSAKEMSTLRATGQSREDVSTGDAAIEYKAVMESFAIVVAFMEKFTRESSLVGRKTSQDRRRSVRPSGRTVDA